MVYSTLTLSTCHGDLSRAGVRVQRPENGNYTSLTSATLSDTITDPDFGIATSFAAPLAWFDPNHGEIGPICNLQQAPYTTNGTTYTIQLEFSNAANDCVLPPF
jgi:hypothetical protein